MGKRGPKPRQLVREPNGRASRTNEQEHLRGERPYSFWAVYFATSAGFTKVGYSGQVHTRMTVVGKEVGATIRMLGAIRLSSEAECRRVEGECHAELKAMAFHYEREWFDMSETDVLRYLTKKKEAGMDVVGITSVTPDRWKQPIHKHSDASGRKFLRIA